VAPAWCMHDVQSNVLQQDCRILFLLLHLLVLPLQADQEAAQIAEVCGSNGTSVCGSQAHDIRDTAPSNRRDSSRLDRITALDAKSHPSAVFEQDLSVKSSSGGHISSGASFCEEMRNRARRMQQEMKKREDSIASLHLQIQNLQDKHRYRSLQIISPELLCSNEQRATLNNKPVTNESLVTLHNERESLVVGKLAKVAMHLQRCGSAAGATACRGAGISKGRI
jgi:hypothetical protein